jgi:O-antigen ligase
VVLAFAIPFGDLRPLPLHGANAVDLLVALLVVVWLAQGVARRKIVLRIPSLAVPVLVLIWIMGLSLTQAGSWSEGLPEWLKWAEFAMLYLVAAQMIGGRTTWWVLGGLFAAGMIEVALGAYQFLRQIGPQEFILMGRFMRAYGTFMQPNPYAGYLGYLVPVAASLAVAGLGRWACPTGETRRWTDIWIAGLCGGVALALAAGIGMSWSRGSWLGLGTALLAVVFLRNRRSAALAAGGVLVLLLFFSVFGTGWLPRSLGARFVDVGGLATNVDPAGTEITDENFALLERLAHWQAGERMFDDHPWLGVGIGNYAASYPAYSLPHWYVALGHAHNVYINFMAETGALGLAAFGAFWLGAAWVAWRCAGRSQGYRAALAVGILGTLTYCTVHNLFDNLFVAHMQLQLALLLAALSAQTGAS